jgi:hypothetical protein
MQAAFSQAGAVRPARVVVRAVSASPRRQAAKPGHREGQRHGGRVARSVDGCARGSSATLKSDPRFLPKP